MTSAALNGQLEASEKRQYTGTEKSIRKKAKLKWIGEV
jgi:hypothetical protein